jgi:hypothetical protein
MAENPENPRPTTDPNQLTLIILFAQIEHLTKTLKPYYDQQPSDSLRVLARARSAKRRNAPSGGSCMTEISAQFSAQ